MKKPLPAPRNEVALAAVGGKIYVVGGSIGGNAVPLIDEYDPSSDGWRMRAAMPKGLDHLGIAVIGGKIITVGGFIGSVHRGAVSDVYEYDPAADTWRTLAPMKNAARLGRAWRCSTARSTPSAGAASTTASRSAPTRCSIRRPGSGPSARRCRSRAITWRWSRIDGKLHAIGGRVTNPASRVAAHDIYDPKTDSWSSGPPLPTARSGLAYANYQGMIVVLGGELAARHVSQQ